MRVMEDFSKGVVEDLTVAKIGNFFIAFMNVREDKNEMTFITRQEDKKGKRSSAAPLGTFRVGSCRGSLDGQGAFRGEAAAVTCLTGSVASGG